MLFDKLPSRELILAELEYRATHRIESFYPETGPLRRELYRMHMDFFEAGARHNERLFLGGNRVGKSEGVGAYECVLHLTGRTPKPSNCCAKRSLLASVSLALNIGTHSCR